MQYLAPLRLLPKGALAAELVRVAAEHLIDGRPINLSPDETRE
jgi:hypothetical protein